MLYMNVRTKIKTTCSNSVQRTDHTIPKLMHRYNTNHICCPIIPGIRTVINRVSVIARRQGSNCTSLMTTCNYCIDDRTFE